MKIRRITATPINLPLEAAYHWAFGDLAGFSMTIVQVETEDGLVGLGEAPSPAAAAVIRGPFAEALVGCDALDIAGAELRCLPSWSGVTSTGDRARITAFGAVEMALWDLRGKAWNQPLYQLLGGAVRKAIPFTDYFSLRADGPGFGRTPPVRGEKTPQDVADYCQHLHETYGTTCFEGKFSTADPAESLAILQAVRDRLGDRVMLRIDSNQAYSLPTALRLARPLEELGIRHWEDPVGSFEGMAELARHCSIPFSSHNLDFGKALALRVPHAICTGPSLLGGIGRFVRFAGACEHAQIDLWCYSGDTGIGSAAYLHLCAALGWIREPNQSLFRMQPMDVIAGGPFQPRDNLVPVPEGPGLGVTLDPEALDSCARAFERDGPYNKFHNPDDPRVFRRLPLS